MTSHGIFNAREWISYLFGVLYFYVCIISSVLHKRILCPSKRNYHGSISRERLSERVAIISKSIKCKNDRRWFPAWLCRGSNSVVRTSTVLFFFNLQSTNASHKASFYYICCYSSRIYAIHSLISFSQILFSYSYFSFAHLRTRTQIPHINTLAFLHMHHIHFAHLLKEYPLLTSNTKQLYNNLKKCIVYMYKDSRSHSKR